MNQHEQMYVVASFSVYTALTATAAQLPAELMVNIIADSQWNGQAVIMLGTDPNIFPSEWTTTYHEGRLLSIV